MNKAKLQEKRAAKRPPRNVKTPSPKPEPVVIGSSCTWGESELEHFKVTICRDVDPHQMIPAEFFDFAHLDHYSECMSVSERC